MTGLIYICAAPSQIFNLTQFVTFTCKAVFWGMRGRAKITREQEFEKFILLSLQVQIFKLLLSEFYRFLMKTA